MSPRARLNIVLICTFIPAIAGMVFGIQMVVIASTTGSLPPFLAPLCVVSVLATCALVMWSTAIRRKLPDAHR